jgi:hypothetical protein
MISAATPNRPAPHSKSRFETLREYLIEEHRDEQSSVPPASRKSFDVWLQAQRADTASLCHAEAVEMAALRRT